MCQWERGFGVLKSDSDQLSLSFDQFLCLQPTISPSHSTSFELQNNLKACDILQSLMQALESTARRGTKAVRGNAMGSGSGRGRAQHNWIVIGGVGQGQGRGRGGTSSGGHGITRPRLTHCTIFDHICFPLLIIAEQPSPPHSYAFLHFQIR